MNLPKHLYKYVSGWRGLQILGARRIRFSPPLTFNDPFEFRPYLHDEPLQDSIIDDDIFWNDQFIGVYSHLIKVFNDRVGILCLTEEPHSILMWGHYADNYRGMAIEFDTTHEFFIDKRFTENRLSLVENVRYSNVRPRLTGETLRSTKFQIMDPQWDGWKSILIENISSFCTKCLDWKYEKEWRLIRELDVGKGESMWMSDTPRLNGYFGLYPDTSNTVKDYQIFDIPPKAISSVIIGAMARRASSQDRVDGLEEAAWRAVLNDKELNHVRVKRAFLDFKTFSVDIVDTEDFEQLKRFIHPQEATIYSLGFCGKSYVEASIKAGFPGISPYHDMEQK